MSIPYTDEIKPTVRKPRTTPTPNGKDPYGKQLLVEIAILGKILADKYAATKKRWLDPKNNEQGDKATYRRLCELYARLN